jgi:hypothetical protein
MDASAVRSSPNQVFLNYRRTESSAEAARLKAALHDLFPQESVFLDHSSIPAGDYWEQVISSALANSAVVLVLIGPTWLYAIDAAGSSRLQTEDDWVRREIEVALGQPDTTVIPVVFDETAIPPAEALPATLSRLPTIQAFRLRQDAWEQDVRGLVLRIHELSRVPIRRPRLEDFDPLVTELGDILETVGPFAFGGFLGIAALAAAAGYALSALGGGTLFIFAGAINVFLFALSLAFGTAKQYGLFKYIAARGFTATVLTAFLADELRVLEYLLVAPIAFLISGTLLLWLTRLEASTVLALSFGAEVVAIVAALAIAERERNATADQAR